MTVHAYTEVSSFILPVKFEGCEQDDQLDFELMFPLSKSTLIASWY